MEEGGGGTEEVRNSPRSFFFFFFKECCVAHMSACPAACKLDGVEGEKGGGSSPFFLSFHSRRTLQGFAEASPLCAERALDAVSFTSHRNHATAISGMM